MTKAFDVRGSTTIALLLLATFGTTPFIGSVQGFVPPQRPTSSTGIVSLNSAVIREAATRTVVGGGAAQQQQQQRLSTQPSQELTILTVKINGVEMQALLDMELPITVFNSEAAKAAGIQTTVASERQQQTSDSSINNKRKRSPLASLFVRFQQRAKAVASDQVMTILGASGELIDLIQSKEKIAVCIDDHLPFCGGHVFVGDLPGLTALLGGRESVSAPAVILGMDFMNFVLRRPLDEAWGY
jgi:hypothetical protein